MRKLDILPVIVIILLFLSLILGQALKANAQSSPELRCGNDKFIDQEVRERVYLACLKTSADARKSKNYKTDDDEDFHHVVNACANQAYYVALRCLIKDLDK